MTNDDYKVYDFTQCLENNATICDRNPMFVPKDKEIRKREVLGGFQIYYLENFFIRLKYLV